MNEETTGTNERQTMSRKEVAKFLGVCYGTLRTLGIPCAKIGRRNVYFRDSVLKWLYEQEKETERKTRKRKTQKSESATEQQSNVAGQEKAKATVGELFTEGKNEKRKS